MDGDCVNDMQNGTKRKAFQRLGDGKYAQFLVMTESRKTSDQTWLHRCGLLVQSHAVPQSIHFWGVTGGGEVRDVKLPYCPECETVDG